MLLGRGNCIQIVAHMGSQRFQSNHTWSDDDAAKFSRSSSGRWTREHALITSVFVEKAGILLRSGAQHACPS